VLRPAPIGCHEFLQAIKLMLGFLGLLFAGSMTITWMWIAASRKYLWLDQPNGRSSHSSPTPTSGGIGFFLVFLAALFYLVMNSEQQNPYLVLLLAGGCLGLLGLADDFRSLGIATRIIIQFLCVLVTISSVGNLPSMSFGFGTIESRILLSAGLIGFGVWQINFFNFMDGIDGLAASEALFVLLCLAWFSAIKGELFLALVCLLLLCAVLGFYVFNMPSAKIFMGDIGSNFLGYCLFFLGILACVRQCLEYWTFFILMSTFLVDSSITLLGRLLGGGVWYHGHRTHAYQLLAVAWNSHFRVVLVYSAINVFWIAPLALMSLRFETLAVYCALLAWLPLVAAVIMIRRKLIQP